MEWSEGFAREVAGMEMVSAVWRAEVVDWIRALDHSRVI